MIIGERHIAILFIKLAIAFIIIGYQINFAQSIDCQTIKFDREDDFLHFSGDYFNSTEDSYGMDNSSMKIPESTPGSPQIVSVQIDHIKGNPGSLSFRWKKGGAYPNYFNLIFYIDNVGYNCSNIENWGNDPFYKKIDYNGRKSHNLKWVLKHDGRDFKGTPSAIAFIDDFTLCGDLIFNGSDADINQGPVPPVGCQPYFKPMEGSLNDSFTFIMNKNVFSNRSVPILQIRNPSQGFWGNFEEVKYDSTNITFIAPDLSFIEPPFLGQVEFRFIDGDKIIGPYKGPCINLNLKDIRKDMGSKTISVDALSSICVEDICLICDDQILRDRYNGCNQWKRLRFSPLNSTEDNLIFDIGVCNE
jgi:hypothetical protein